jgi:hypothetical protein
MIKSEKTYKVLFFSCLSILLGVCVYVFSYEKNNPVEKMSDSTLVDNISLLKLYELESEGFKLSPELMVEDETGKKIYLKDIVKDKGKVLIYRFGETHCDLCIIQHLMILKDLSNKIGLSKLVLLSRYTSVRKSKIFKQTHDLSFGIFNIMDNMDIPLEQVNTPYFFVMDENLTCCRFFAATKENPQLTISCLRIVINDIDI